MRIAVVHDTVYPFFKGGSQKRAYEISRRLVQRGHVVHWYGMDYGASEIEGIRLHAVSPEYRLYTQEGRRIVTQAIKFGARLNIRERVDVIDCTNFPYLHCFRAKEASMRQHVPLVITWFEYWGDYWYEYMKGRWPVALVGKTLERMIAHFPNLIISDSEKVKKQLIGVKVDGSKIRVIPDGADIGFISSVEPSKDKYDVVYVGRIVAHKNVDVLVRAVAAMGDVTMAVIGTGQKGEECEALSIELGAKKRIKFLGHVPKDNDVYAIMKSAKVLVLPSVQEGHPHVIPEANACGIPVIGIKGICDEFIKHGETGYVCNLHKYPMRLLITRALELYPKFKKPCEAESKKYDWEILTDRVEETYKELI
jgi:glycosyltransferase involved in cell wall biosynthesis